MKRFIIVLILILVPNFAFASASGNSASATLSSTFTVFSAVAITQLTQMVFPTAIANNNPSVWATDMTKGVTGGVDGTNGVMRITAGSAGQASLSMAATTIAGYPITFSSATNTPSFALAATVNVTLKGTINASATAFTAGPYGASTICTVAYQ